MPHGDDRVDIVVDGKKVGSAQRTKTGGLVAFDALGREMGVVAPEEAALGNELASEVLAN